MWEDFVNPLNRACVLASSRLKTSTVRERERDRQKERERDRERERQRERDNKAPTHSMYIDFNHWRTGSTL